jgi:hypothetical protein
MNDDQFENELKRQPLRPVPVAWREEILKAACHRHRRAVSTSTAEVVPWWRALLWPNPVAWGGLAAAWLVVLTLACWTFAQEAASASGTATAARRVDVATALVMQQELAAELASLEAGRDTPPPKAGPRPGWGPQSRRAFLPPVRLV